MLALLQNLVEQYGYWAVAAGCVVEGEITILLGAAAVHGGLLKLAWVMLAAFTGTMLSDIASYLIGRHFGQAALARRSRRWRARARLTERLLARYGAPAIVGYRFIFGMRTVASLVFGTLNVSPARFLLLSGLGAVLWTLLFSVLGLLLATTIDEVIEHVQHAEIVLLGMLLVVVLMVAVVVFWRRRAARQRRAGVAAARAATDERRDDLPR